MTAQAKVLQTYTGRNTHLTKSSRALRLYKIKKMARIIREQHAKGELSAEEAAKQLRALHSRSSRAGLGFKLQGEYPKLCV